MTCASCAARIEKGLKAVSGVTEAQVNLATEKAEITFHPEEVEEKSLVQTIRDLGYEVNSPRRRKNDHIRRGDDLRGLREPRGKDPQLSSRRRGGECKFCHGKGHGDL